MIQQHPLSFGKGEQENTYKHKSVEIYLHLPNKN